MDKWTKPKLREGNYLFLLVTFLLLSLGAYFQRKNIYLGIVVTQYILILLPVLAYLKFKGYGLVENLRLNRTSLKNVLITMLIVIFTYPIAVSFNLVTILIIDRFGSLRELPLPVAKSGAELFKNFFFIALTPGICEEILFRGFLMRAYEGLGRTRAIVFSAILFAVFHYNFQNLLGPLLLGLVFGLIVFKTDSLYLSIVGHTFNNSLALVLGYYMRKLDPSSFQPDALGGGTSFLSSLLTLLMILTVSSLIVYLLMARLDEGKTMSPRVEKVYDNVIVLKEEEKLDLISLMPIFICLAIYIAMTYDLFFS